jgi:hypothetical protein
VVSKFTSPAVVKALALHDPHGLAVAPERVAEVLQHHLSELVSQGYQVLSVTHIHGALLTIAIAGSGRTPVEPIGKLTNRDGTPLRWYGCEGLTCRPGSHTLECPHIDQGE